MSRLRRRKYCQRGCKDVRSGTWKEERTINCSPLQKIERGKKKARGGSLLDQIRKCSIACRKKIE